MYAASKAAVLSFTTSLQGDLHHAGLPIRARALCPDVVSTKMVTDRVADPERRFVRRRQSLMLQTSPAQDSSCWEAAKYFG